MKLSVLLYPVENWLRFSIWLEVSLRAFSALSSPPSSAMAVEAERSLARDWRWAILLGSH